MSASFNEPSSNEDLTYETFDPLAYSSARGHGFFVVAEGFAKVEMSFAHRTKTIQILCPGDVAPSFPPNGRLSITALSPMRVSFQSHHALMSSGLAVDTCMSLFGHIEASYMKLATRLWILESRSVRARVAGTLLGLRAREAHNERRSKPPVVSVDRKTLAEIAGTAPETLSRILTEFEGEHTIRRSGREISIVDERRLLDTAASY